MTDKAPATTRPKQQVSVVQSAPDPDSLEENIQQVEREYRQLQLQRLQQAYTTTPTSGVLKLTVNGLLPSVWYNDGVRMP